jgi:hypothetical protein|tara:strand:+ start:834 stop:1133 length:300 start_codon:yes stop_codon:yes gene_type:complete
MLPIGNDKDGNFLFIKKGATEKDYYEVKKMNRNMIDQAYASGDINEEVRDLFYDVWDNPPIIQDDQIRVMMTQEQYFRFLELMPTISEDLKNDKLFTKH